MVNPSFIRIGKKVPIQSGNVSKRETIIRVLNYTAWKKKLKSLKKNYWGVSM